MVVQSIDGPDPIVISGAEASDVHPLNILRKLVPNTVLRLGTVSRL